MWINLDAIQLWDSNPNEGHVGAIYASIERFGFRNPIGLNKGNITHNGNHRVKALHELRKAGWQPFGSCIRVTDDGTWEVECVDNTDLSESDSVAYGLADNRTARLGRDDAAKLLALLTPLEAEDILAAGYDESDLNAIADILHPFSGGDTHMHKTPSELLTIFENASIKQVVLYFKLSEYDDFLERLEKVMMDNDIEDNTSGVMFLLRHYEDNPS